MGGLYPISRSRADSAVPSARWAACGRGGGTRRERRLGAGGCRRRGAARPGGSIRPMTDTVRVGLLGCGNVGAAVARMVHDHAEDIALRSGIRLEVTRIAVRDLARERDVPVPAGAFI